MFSQIEIAGFFDGVVNELNDKECYFKLKHYLDDGRVMEVVIVMPNCLGKSLTEDLESGSWISCNGYMTIRKIYNDSSNDGQDINNNDLVVFAIRVLSCSKVSEYIYNSNHSDEPNIPINEFDGRNLN